MPRISALITRFRPISNVVALLLLPLLMSGCNRVNDSQPIRLAVSPWPGYEYLYLAHEKGFFAQEGIQLEILELYSLADALRTFTQGRADGMASTISEVVQAASMTDDEIHIVLVTDYSDGADVIIAQQRYPDIPALKGKRVGAEPGSLGIMLLSLALAENNMDINDIEYVALGQAEIPNALLTDKIDAGVTYAPFSNGLQNGPSTHTIFDSGAVPGEIVDVVSFSGKLGLSDSWLGSFQRAWQRALDYAQHHPDEADKFMAERERQTVAAFLESRQGLKIVSGLEQAGAVSVLTLNNTIMTTCQTLGRLQSIRKSCTSLHSRIILRVAN
jgi:NitT/TauT family transport system substrate-binding protein